MNPGFDSGSAGGAAGFSELELDLLADYAAGVLDRTDAAAVARRMDEDERWARAHAALVEADAAVREDLRLAATSPDPMPADVVARVDAALTRCGRTPALTAAVVPLDTARAKRRAKRRRVVTGLAAAAAAVVAIAGGIGIAGTDTFRADNPAAAPNAESAKDRAASGAGTAATPSPQPALAQAPTMLTSGIDYRPETLTKLAQAPEGAGAAPPAAQEQKSADEVPQAVRDNTPTPLARLTGPTELAACLDAIRSRHAGVVRLLDFARFNGAPAVVVVVQSGPISTVVAVGPDCGLAGADEKGLAVA